MSIIQDSLKPEIETFLAGLDRVVTVDFYPHPESPASAPTKDLIEELHQLAPFISPVYHSPEESSREIKSPDVVEGPITTLSVDGQFTGIRYLGFPGGHEFGALLADLRDLSHGEPVQLSPETVHWLQGLTRPLHLEVFTTPT